MTENFRVMNAAELAALLKERGLSTIEIGDSLRTVEQILVLSDGMKPVYVVEVDPESYNDPSTMGYIMDEFFATNLTGIIVPSGIMKVTGAVTAESFDSKESSNG